MEKLATVKRSRSAWYKISRAAETKGLSPKGITDEIKTMNQKYGLPNAYQPWEAEKILFRNYP